MKNKQRKGFTIVELVIVIAIIAILAAVLIPTFSNVIYKAKVSKDTQLIRNLNTALAADNQEHNTMQSAVEAAEAFGYSLEKIDASATDNKILWDSVNDVFCYYNKDSKNANKVEYIPDTQLTNKEVADVDYWMIANELPLEPKYSIYAGANWTESGSRTVATNLQEGFDVGENGNKIKSIKYVRRESATAQNVVIRTDGGSLTVDAPLDNIQHYGKLGQLELIACADHSYHESGTTNYVKITDGRIVLEDSATLNLIYVAGNTAKIAYKNSEDLPTISRSAEVSEFTLQKVDNSNNVVESKKYVISGSIVTVNGEEVANDTIANGVKEAVNETEAQKARYFASMPINPKGKNSKEYQYETQEELFDALNLHYQSKGKIVDVFVTLCQPKANVTVPKGMNVKLKNLQNAESIVNYGSLNLRTGTCGAKITNYGNLTIEAAVTLTENTSFEGKDINLENVAVTKECIQKGNLDAYLKSGESYYQCKNNSYKVYNVNKGIAKVGDYYYNNLPTALKDSTSDNYAILISDFKISSTSGAVSLNGHLNMNGHTIIMDNGTIISINTRTYLIVDGQGTIRGSTDLEKSLVQIKGTNAKYISESKPVYEAFKLGESVVLENPTGYGVGIFEHTKNAGCSDGIIVNIEGTIKASSAISIAGSIKAINDFVPVINVTATAKLESTDTAIYAAGYGIWTIDGHVTGGATGMEIRAGKLTVNSGAVIEGKYTSLVPDQNGSGTTTKGAGLAVIQHSTKLPIEVTINGGTIKGFVGIYEGNPQGNTTEDLAKIVINVNDGTISSTQGAEGNAVQISDADVTCVVSEAVVLTGNKQIASSTVA